MDSGMTIGQDAAAGFDPLMPLLPEELCWILDRMFACEVNRTRSFRLISRLNVLYDPRWNGILEIRFLNRSSHCSMSTTWLTSTRTCYSLISVFNKIPHVH